MGVVPVELALNTLHNLIRVLDQVLGLQGRSVTFQRDTALLGAVPELDSMAVVALITAIEDQFGVAIDDDDINSATFATVGSLSDFISSRVAA